MNNLQKSWEGYRSTLPDNASQGQVMEARLGFFSGALSIYNLMMAKAMDETVSQEEGEKFLASLAVEINDFMGVLLTSERPIRADCIENKQ